jgi:hypothetical protein
MVRLPGGNDHGDNHHENFLTAVITDGNSFSGN